MSEKRVQKTLSTIKSLPVSLAKLAPNDDNGAWVWATREIVDSVGDVVRVDGVDFSLYHNPPESSLKILAQHLRDLPDGKAPVVGVVDQVVKTTTTYKGESVRGIAVHFKWLRNAAGELLELAKHYKEMVDAGGIDSVSVGLIVNEFDGYEPTGGLDITSSSIFELSLVTIPANAAATAIKSLIDDQAVALDAERTKEIVPCEIDGTCEVVEDGCCTRKTPEKQAEITPPAPAVEVQPDAQNELMKGIVAEATAPFTDAIKYLTDMVRTLVERIDVLESALVVATTAESPASDDHKTVTAMDEDELKLLAAKLDSLAKYLK